jgi:hypothetical protein
MSCQSHINRNNQGLVEPVAIGTGYVLLSQTIVEIISSVHRDGCWDTGAGTADTESWLEH